MGIPGVAARQQKTKTRIGERENERGPEGGRKAGGRGRNGQWTGRVAVDGRHPALGVGLSEWVSQRRW